MFRPRSAFPSKSAAVPSSSDLCALRVSAFNSLSLSSFHILQSFQRSTLSRVISLGMRTYAKYTPNPFRMRSFKTQDLKPFRMCSSKKTGVGERSSSTSYPIELGVFIWRSPGRTEFCRGANRCACHDRSPPGRSRSRNRFRQASHPDGRR
jgi:hypothetical protein